MRFSILLAFLALLGSSFAGETKTKGPGRGTRSVDGIAIDKPTVNKGYDEMTNRKLWRELIKKGRSLEIVQLQMQHLLNLLQERINKLNHMRTNYKVPVPLTDKPAEIARGIQYILEFIADFYETNIRHLDGSEASRPRIGNNNYQGPYRHGGSIVSNKGSSKVGRAISPHNQGLKTQVPSGLYPPIGGSIYEPRMNRPTSSPNKKLYPGNSKVSTTSSSHNNKIGQNIQPWAYPQGWGSTHGVSNKPNEDASQVGAINGSPGKALEPQLHSPAAGKDTSEPGMSHQTSLPNEPYQGSQAGPSNELGQEDPSRDSPAVGGGIDSNEQLGREAVIRGQLQDLFWLEDQLKYLASHPDDD